MFNAKVIISGAFILSLIGCGGGGDSAADIPEDETTAIEEPVVVLPDEATVDMSELKASEDFTFTSKEQIQVTLDISGQVESDTRAYVSVYSDYTLLDSGQFYANASSRVVAGTLENGLFTSSFTSLDDHSTYLIEVWFYDGEQPLQSEQSIVDNTLTW